MLLELHSPDSPFLPSATWVHSGDPTVRSVWQNGPSSRRRAPGDNRLESNRRQTGSILLRFGLHRSWLGSLSTDVWTPTNGRLDRCWRWFGPHAGTLGVV